MIKSITEKHLKPPLYPLREENHLIYIFPMMIFVFLSTIKITLFDFFTFNNQTLGVFSYKFLMTFLVLIIIYPFLFQFKNFMPLLLVYIAETIYIMVNISYFSFYHNYLHMQQWFILMKEALISAGHSSAPVNYKLFIAFIDIPAFIFVLFKYYRLHYLHTGLRLHRLVVAAISFLIILCIEVGNFANHYSFIDFANDKYGGEVAMVERYGTLTNSLINFFTKDGNKEIANNLKKYGIQTNTQLLSDMPNIIAIQVESMDANIVNEKYKGEYVMPFLHEMTDKAIYYPFVMSYHMGGGTSDSEFSIMNSVEPLPYYPAIKLSGYTYPNSLIKILDKSSYTTTAFHGNVAEFYDRNKAFPKMGFNNFYDIDKMQMKDVGWGAPDKDVFNFAEDYSKRIKAPFFSYTITMTSHTPFESASKSYNNPLYDDIDDTTVRNYFNSFSYVDSALKEYVDRIRADFKNTYIFIWGDHTPSIESSHYTQATMTYDNKYFEFVPLIIITPDNKVYKEEHQIASFLDISPTILRAAGVKFKIRSVGEDLINVKNKLNAVPFKEGLYDRAELFDALTEKLQKQNE